MAKKRIKDLTNTVTNGYLAVDNATEGTGKMLTSTIFNNFAGEFIPSSTSALKDCIYVYAGALYKAKEDYTGVWNASKFTRVSIIDILNACIRLSAQTCKNKCELFTERGRIYQSTSNVEGAPPASDILPTGLYDWIAPTKFLFDNIIFGKLYLLYGSFGSSYDPYNDVYSTTTRIRTSFVYTGKEGGKFIIDYGQSNLTTMYLFYFDIDDESGRLKYDTSSYVSLAEEVNLEKEKVAVLVFRNRSGTSDPIPSTAFNELSVRLELQDSGYEAARKTDFSLFNEVDAIGWEQGGIDGNGNDTSPSSAYYSNRIKTNFLEVTADRQVIDFNDDTYKIRWFTYSAEKVFVSWGDVTTSPIQTTRSVGTYERFCLIRKDGLDIVPEEGFENTYSVSGLDTGYKIYEKPAYSSETEQKFLTGKKVVFIGDSITAGAGAGTEGERYVNIFGAITGADVVNLGMNGTCIANNTKNGQSANRFVTRATSANLSDADLVVVFGGTNDLSYDSKAIGDHFSETTITASGNIGTKQLGAVSDTDTFAGALHDLITTIQTNVSVNTPILFLTPLHRNNNSASNPNSYQCNSNGDFMKDFVNAIKDICGFYAIPVLDMYSDAELNPLVPNYSGLFSDGLHPNAAGHKVIAERIASFVKNSISFI